MTIHTPILKPLGCPQGVDPRTWRQEVEKRLNDLLDRAMSLITALDVMEADCDLEDTGDDEPSLGWGLRGSQSFLAGTAPNLAPCDTVDLELDNCDDEPGGDDEAEHDSEEIMWPDDLPSQEVLVQGMGL